MKSSKDKLVYMLHMRLSNVFIIIWLIYVKQLAETCVVPVPGRSAPVLADSQPAGPWSGSLQHTRSSLGLDRRCPAGPILVPEATHNDITTRVSKNERDHERIYRVILAIPHTHLRQVPSFRYILCTAQTKMLFGLEVSNSKTNST